MKKIYDFYNKKFFSKEHLWKLMFSFEGRINRQRFYFGKLILLIILFILGILFPVINEFGGAILFLISVVLSVPLIIKRCHDLNKSLKPLAYSLGVLWGLDLLRLVTGLTIIATIHTWLSGVFVICVIIFFFYIAFNEGTIGDNKYGKDPIRGEVVEAKFFEW